jgi:hypothetical protein
MKPRVGDWVRVRSKAEILATLDKNGRLEGLPFMPQMFQYCGQEFRVYKRAHKTCDTVSGAYVSRQLPGGVHLDLRCDGKVYGGCEAGCLIYWKEAWLAPSGEAADLEAHGNEPSPSGMAADARCTEEDVLRATRTTAADGSGEIRYVCQATELLKFTKPLQWWDFRQYYEDYASGNISLGRMLRGFLYVAYNNCSLSYRNRLGRPGRWLYNSFQSLWGGIPFPREKGKIDNAETAPTCDLNLQPGEYVRVKSYDEILATITRWSNRNRGLYFDAEMVPFCNREFRVRARIHQFVDEQNGKLRTLKTPAVILEGMCCAGRYSERRMFCPRGILPWWREIWLERVEKN